MDLLDLLLGLSFSLGSLILAGLRRLTLRRLLKIAKENAQLEAEISKATKRPRERKSKSSSAEKDSAASERSCLRFSPSAG